MTIPDTVTQPSAGDAPSFWDRLVARTRVSGSLEVVEDRSVVAMLVTVTFAISTTMACLGALSYFRFDEAQAGVGMLCLVGANLVGWTVYTVTGNVTAGASIAIFGSAIFNTYIHVVLGGYAYSGGILMWSITAILLTAVVIGRSVTLVLAGLFAIQAVVFAFLEVQLIASRPAPDSALSAQMFGLVLAGNLLVLTPMFTFLLRRLSIERNRAESLLLNVLPREVAAELKATGSVAPRRIPAVSVVFIDIVDFTPHSAGRPPEEVVSQLNAVFSRFDALSDECGCEKIRTIGDAYMAAAGVPIERSDHAVAAARLALAMMDAARSTGFTFRAGIHSGPVVAGVIGTTKFQYDVWGDTVNVASRMESQGEPGRIQISDATHALLTDSFRCSERGRIDVKGRGEITTWFLESSR